MRKIPLLPRYFRWIGIVLFILGISFDYYADLLQFNPIQDLDDYWTRVRMFVFYADSKFSSESEVWFGLTYVDIALTFKLLSSMLGLALIAFSKNKQEDEMINSIRLSSWLWAIILIVIFSTITTLFIYGTSYLSFSCAYIHIMLIFYIVIFWINIWKMNRRLGNEE